MVKYSMEKPNEIKMTTLMARNRILDILVHPDYLEPLSFQYTLVLVTNV